MDGPHTPGLAPSLVSASCSDAPVQEDVVGALPACAGASGDDASTPSDESRTAAPRAAAQLIAAGGTQRQRRAGQAASPQDGDCTLPAAAGATPVAALGSLSLRELRAFVLVAELTSFRAAGDVLWLDASTVTKLVRRLEREVGAPLFHRTTRMVRLTPAGAAALPAARAVLAAAEQFRAVSSGEALAAPAVAGAGVPKPASRMSPSATQGAADDAQPTTHDRATPKTFPEPFPEPFARWSPQAGEGTATGGHL